MDIASFYVLIVIVFMTIALAKDLLRPGLILLTAAVLFYLPGVINSKEFLSGFSNSGMITVAVLFVISEGIKNTGALEFLATFFMPKKKHSYHSNIFRILPPVSLLSSFLNNTPVVVIFAPIIKKWANNFSFIPSKYLIPLSFASIFGGVCTLIGTSTNLVVYGMMINNGQEGLGMFELAKIGLPVLIIGTIYLAVIGRFLPERTAEPISDLEENTREYLIEMKILPGSNLINKSVASAGLRNLKNLYLMAIDRQGVLIETVNDDEILLEHDRLIFTGVTESITDLNKFSGLVPAEHNELKADYHKMKKHFAEVVVSHHFSGLGKTVKENNFRSSYRAVVIAVHREGKRIKSKIGNLKLQAGDHLILLTTKNFVNRWKNTEDFYMITNIKSPPPVQPKKTILSIGLILFMVIGASVGPELGFWTGNPLNMLFFALLVLVVMIWTKCIDPNKYTSAIHWDVLITIACAFGISAALQNSGLATAVAESIINLLSPFGYIGVLAGIYLLTTLFTEIITNNAAAALVFPIAVNTAANMGVSPRPFMIAVCIAASASFATPIGYQTNLIVQGIGGYKFNDFLKFGIPLNFIVFLTSMLLIPFFWSF